MYLGVSLQVVRPDESLAAVDTFILAVSQVRLHMGAHVLTTLEAGAVAAGEEAGERVSRGVVLDQAGDFFGRDARVFDDGFEAEVGD
jgi:hypothetical protein